MGYETYRIADLIDEIAMGPLDQILKSRVLWIVAYLS